MPAGVSVTWRGARGGVQCSVYPDRTPILCGDGAGMSLTLTPGSPQVVTAPELSFARALLGELRVYVTECERWARRAGEVNDTGE